VSPAAEAQLREIERLWQRQQLLPGARNTKSKAYRDLMSQITQAVNVFQAIIAREKEFP
jgi:hypothetical protein